MLSFVHSLGSIDQISCMFMRYERYTFNYLNPPSERTKDWLMTFESRGQSQTEP